MLRLVLLAVALLFAARIGTAATPEPAIPLDLTGIYLCEGTNPDGTPYAGFVEIASIDNTYLVRWVMPNSRQIMGVGIRNEGVLAVSYFGGTPAVVVYAIDGEKLVGQWTMGGTEGMTYSETLTRMPEGQAIPAPPQREQAAPPARPRRTPRALTPVGLEA